MLENQRSTQFEELMRERMSKLAADTARSINPQGVNLTGPAEAFRDPEPDHQDRRGLGRMFLDAVNPFSDFNTSIRRGVVRGVIGAIDETGDLITTFGGYLADVTGLGEKYGGQDFVDWWAQDDDDRNPLHIGKQVVDDLVGFRGPTTLIGGLVEGIAQIGVGMLGVGKIVKLKEAGAITKGLVVGGIADAIFFDANEQRLGNMIENGPEWLQTPLIQYIAGVTAARETDGELEGRFKNALEGLLLGGSISALMHGAKVSALKFAGRNDAARVALRDYTPKPLQGVVELPNGKARLATSADDTQPFLTKVDEGRYEFVGKNGEAGALEAHMSHRVATTGEVIEDVLVIEEIGKLMPDGTINTAPGSGFRMGSENIGKMGAELIADFPAATRAQGLHRLSGKFKEISLRRWSQEVFDSPGGATAEALSRLEIAKANVEPLGKMGKGIFGDLEKVTTAYRTNRTLGTIRRAERAWVKNLRVNPSAGRQDIADLITDVAKGLSKAGGGSAKIMQKLGDESLSGIVGRSMEGLRKHPKLADIGDQLVIRRAAGLVLQALGDDISRYSIRTNQGGSVLSYLEMGRALDQMIHVEEILTGRPAVWLDTHRKIFGKGKVQLDPNGRFRNIDAPEIKEATAQDIRDQKTSFDAEGKPITDAELNKATEAVAGEGPGKPAAEAAAAAPDVPPAGVAPGPKSLRNMSKGEIMMIGRWVALADGEPRAIITALKSLRIQALASAGKPGMKLALLRWRLSAMLSGFGTQAVNVVSTGIQTALLPTELLVGGIMSGQPRVMREAAYTMVGLITEAGDAMRASFKAFKAGKGSLDPGFMTRELEAGRFEGFLAIANVPQDFLTSADEFFKVLNYRAKVRGKSLSQSAAAGLDWVEASKRMFDDLDNAMSIDGAGLNTNALEYARRGTFTDALTGSAAKLSGVLHADDTLLGTVGQLFVPFIRTPHNIMRNIILRSPLAAFNMAGHSKAVAAGGAEMAAAMGRMATAGAMVGTAGLLVSSGRITGRGPMHPDTRRAWKAAGFVPYTIDMGNGVLLKYNRLSSIFGPLAMMADLHYVNGSLRTEEALEGVAQITASILSYVSDQGFVGNMSEMFDTIISGDAHKMQVFVEKTAIGMVVPQALSQFTGLDDTMRETEGFMDELYKKTPGLSESLPPRRNIFREPVIKAPGSLDRIFNPFTQLGPTDNVTAMALWRVGRNMGMPGETRFDGRVDLRDTDRFGEVEGMSPYEFWLEKTAKGGSFRTSLKQELTKLVNSRMWERMPPGSEDWEGGPRYVEVARVLKRRQDIAEQEMLVAFPELRRLLQQETLLKRFGAFGGKPATDRLQQRFQTSADRRQP